MSEKNSREKSGIRGRYVCRLALLALAIIVVTATVLYTTTQSFRSGQESYNKEMGGPHLTLYPSRIRTTVSNMIESGAVVENIRFNRPEELSQVLANEYAVFAAENRGVSYTTVPAIVMASGLPGEWTFNMDLALPDMGTKDTDLVAYLPHLKKEICEQLNRELGLPVPVPKLKSDQSALYSKRMVTGYVAPQGKPLALDVYGIKGQPFGCFQSYNHEIYVYYHMIVPR